MKKKFSKEYIDYINSPKWKKKRFMALIHYGNKCDKCGATKKLDVHHLTYERFTKELLSDLQILCRTCHNEVHGIIDASKKVIIKPSRKRKKFRKNKKEPCVVLPKPKQIKKYRKSRSKMKIPVGSTIVLKIRNPGSAHELPARLRNKFQ